MSEAKDIAADVNGVAVTTLLEDAQRARLPFETGIFVRAKRAVPEGQPERWGPVDIMHLTKESLVAWLKSRGPEFTINVVLSLLQHDR